LKRKITSASRPQRKKGEHPPTTGEKEKKKKGERTRYRCGKGVLSPGAGDQNRRRTSMSASIIKEKKKDSSSRKKSCVNGKRGASSAATYHGGLKKRVRPPEKSRPQAPLKEKKKTPSVRKIVDRWGKKIPAPENCPFFRGEGSVSTARSPPCAHKAKAGKKGQRRRYEGKRKEDQQSERKKEMPSFLVLTEKERRLFRFVRRWSFGK